MKYHIPVGTTVYLCKLDPKEYVGPESKDPWLPWRVRRAVTYTDVDRKIVQIANKDECYEFYLPLNDQGATFLAVYKNDVVVVE